MRKNWWTRLASPDNGGQAAGGDAGAGGGTGTGQGSGSATQPTKTEAEKAFTQAEVDRLRTEAVKTAEARVRRELEEKAAADKKAAEEAAMKEQQKFKELYEAKEREANALKLKSETHAELAAQGLSNVAGFFDGDLGTIEGRKAAIGQLAKVINEAVEAKVAERLKLPSAGKGSGGGTPAAATAEEIEKMSMDEYVRRRKAGQIA